MNAWTIPFENTNYLCWKDKKGTPQHRPMTAEEEQAYFIAQNKEKFLDDLLNKR